MSKQVGSCHITALYSAVPIDVCFWASIWYGVSSCLAGGTWCAYIWLQTRRASSAVSGGAACF